MNDILKDVEALRGEIRALRTRLQEAERETQTAVMDGCAMAYEEICELLGIKISERWPAREVAIPVLDEMRDLRVRLQRIRKTAVAALNNRESSHVIEHALTTIRDEAAAALEEPEP